MKPYAVFESKERLGRLCVLRHEARDLLFIFVIEDDPP